MCDAFQFGDKNACWIGLCNFLYIFPKYKNVMFCQNAIFLLRVFEDIKDKISLENNFIYQILFIPIMRQFKKYSIQERSD